MARIRTHNNRARRIAYAVFARRRAKARKVLRYAAMYGAGPRKLREAIQNRDFDGNHAAKLLDDYRAAFPTIRDFVDEFFKQEPGPVSGTVSGRMVSRGPGPQYQISKRSRQIPTAFVDIDYSKIEDRVMRTLTGKALVQYRLQEEAALKVHRANIDAARERGDTVIEHTYADATIIPKGGDDD